MYALHADKVVIPVDSHSCQPRVEYDEPLSVQDVPDMAALDNHTQLSAVHHEISDRLLVSRVDPRAADKAVQGNHSELWHCDARHLVHVSTPAPFNDRRATNKYTPHTTRFSRFISTTFG